MTDLRTIVIVGAGQAGFCCAKELRARDFQGTITLIGEESYPPYDRPPLSKAVLLGKATVESTFYFTTAQLESAGITFFPNSPALSIDRSRKLVLCPEQELPYDHLVIATGAQVRRLPIPGSEDADILYLRGIDDCLQLQRRIMSGCRVLVIGGGLIGLEVAAAATTLGASATVIEAAERSHGSGRRRGGQSALRRAAPAKRCRNPDRHIAARPSAGALGDGWSRSTNREA